MNNKDIDYEWLKIVEDEVYLSLKESKKTTIKITGLNSDERSILTNRLKLNKIHTTLKKDYLECANS